MLYLLYPESDFDIQLEVMYTMNGYTNVHSTVSDTQGIVHKQPRPLHPNTSCNICFALVWLPC